MDRKDAKETKRRSLLKSLIWRLIGIVWTWVGAYLILLLIPEKYNTAGMVATLLVVYHHSTRMVMYYGYERLWSHIQWGRTEEAAELSAKGKLAWMSGSAIFALGIFYLILVGSPLVKGA